ncbi:flavin reductase family protein [Bacterioplanoides sp. SCSIO 12839]|uniref:flavin reductase family protein n=1 Tax=Bacterioplanoides sp. SCSIO 12839 TaxID=2829569 RepID=UPI002105285A|nr:FAD-binding oxidoreductase [Bacterioplanoides sp. SCSIO 12839]UTW47361.1 hypothetical protein KFF03_12310 [Bacterioplanoides sp. SCSIO 12839]
MTTLIDGRSRQSLSLMERVRESKAWSWLAESLTQDKRFSYYFEPLMQMLVPNWSSVYSRATILTSRNETDDVFTLVIRPQKGWVKERFLAGQHIELITEKDGVRSHRTFSISSSPEYFRKTGLIELTIRVQDQGAITPWLQQHFVQGGLANISAPFGDFTLEHIAAEKGNGAPVLMIAGGSGITPFRSMLQQLQATGESRPVHLMYYARNDEQFLFRHEFERLLKEQKHVSLSLMNGEQVGFIQAQHFSDLPVDILNPELQVMICGPTPMIQLARQEAELAGIAAERIAFEYFGAAPIDQVDGVEGQQHVSCTTSSVQLLSDSEHPKSLLELAEEADLKPVSGCRIGVCHQCICKKQSGVVYNTKTQQYSDTGPQEIQLCVSVPVTDVALDL